MGDAVVAFMARVELDTMGFRALVIHLMSAAAMEGECNGLP